MQLLGASLPGRCLRSNRLASCLTLLDFLLAASSRSRKREFFLGVTLMQNAVLFRLLLPAAAADDCGCK